MLTQTHLDSYKMNILTATGAASALIRHAETIAESVSCEGCRYCMAAARHKKILKATAVELLLMVNDLEVGEKSVISFPKKMFPGMALYRGFITDEGEYLDLFNTDHCNFRQTYIALHGQERAFRMITVHSSSFRNQVHFVDRKQPPSKEQYATLRNLMIEAEGLLAFRFDYDTNHPKV